MFDYVDGGLEWTMGIGTKKYQVLYHGTQKDVGLILWD